MIPLLLQRIISGVGGNPPMAKEDAARRILTADPFDLVLHMEQLWDVSKPWGAIPAAGPGRRAFYGIGEFASYVPTDLPAWDHLGYSYVLENTRIVQILRRVVREYRSGEGLGLPSIETQRWLDVTEALLFGAANPVPSWLSTSVIRQDPEAVRRNAYWRFFGLDLAFGTDDNRPPVYDKATATNTGFVRLLEELLFELWQAMTNVRNIAGANASDDDRIFRIAEELGYILRSRRQKSTLKREELAAATVLGWAELTVAINSSLVSDLSATATNPATRLQLIGERVGLAAHSKSAAFFSMAADLSVLLYTIEAGVVSGPEFAWVLYMEQLPPGKVGKPIGAESRRVITEWAAATGKDLKVRAKAVETTSRPRVVAAA
ncbi:hypothetical protein QO004_006209 [Rhizobium mesoamericanum]|uniref:hypothetical protein n=1 Tax=Rhizobium mesoamericanum TaxID=1079800 RepID=UPI002787CB2A|nr:hypothetical protein [Rhizobium mesoamericanum]MDQ0564391.1 hypothetical protein [Rhizobium mesoamericanum]